MLGIQEDEQGARSCFQGVCSATEDVERAVNMQCGKLVLKRGALCGPVEMALGDLRRTQRKGTALVS